MIQAIKDAVLAYLGTLTGAGELCEGLTASTDSEVEVQPTKNSPLFQMRFKTEGAPTGIQGIGSASRFGTQIVFSCVLKSVTPEPQGSRDLFALWYRRDEDTGNLRGLKIALHQLLATGLTVGLDQFQVGITDATPAHSQGAHGTGIAFELAFVRMFNG